MQNSKVRISQTVPITGWVPIIGSFTLRTVSFTYKLLHELSASASINKAWSYIIGMGGTQNFVHGIYREKIPRYRVYRGTCFVVVVTKAKHAQQSK